MDQEIFMLKRFCLVMTLLCTIYCIFSIGSHCVLYYIPVCLMQCRKLTAALPLRYVMNMHCIKLQFLQARKLGGGGRKACMEKVFEWFKCPSLTERYEECEDAAHICRGLPN